jgi:two-component system, LytTR family, response regulator
MTRPWKALIVDDEPRARSILRRLLSADPDFSLAAECGNGYDAVGAVLEHRPDLLLLDVQMPEMGGFEVLQQISVELLPLVVFVTAYEQYAIRAFEVNALDYLLKPFDEERFAATMSRVKLRLAEEAGLIPGTQMLALLKTLKSSNSNCYIERFVVRLRGRMLLIQAGDVDWLQAEDNYVRIHSGTASYLHRETLSNLTTKLNPRKFVRVHRSALVNVDKIREVLLQDGEYQLVLVNGSRVGLSRTYRDEFFAKINSGIHEAAKAH